MHEDMKSEIGGEAMSPSEIKKANRRRKVESLSENQQAELKAIEQELEQEEKDLSRWPQHGIGEGHIELEHIEKNHPILKMFFSFAGTVLDLDRKEEQELYNEYQKPFLNGKLLNNPSKLKKFEEDYADPFYAEFFSRANMVLKLSGKDEKRLNELEVLHGKNKLAKEGEEELAKFIEKFCLTLEREKDKKIPHGGGK